MNDKKATQLFNLFSELQKEVHQNAVAHKFHQKKRPDVPKMLCLIHSEVSEALEVDRRMGYDHPLFAEEMADIVIRAMDTCERLGINLINQILAKHDKNKGRPIRHGKRY